ncbi:CDP-alcohol phosphatidyltransferase family protein [Actinomadura rubrisoli]|uniref:CDP-alcohol phosphatidyltransferase family protein n=1 Tax=Actinomadura rubrisoli TaxID=2530368 RepID=A0A4R5AY20_9ACTN|nr:CDP-alcohol phosphatidyltransferase family protein [Actinomadura rubrisoli]TDD76124.1 CDP-alcohol phosphatidyltransferase family protein [Actinomadura rubrisoli]
MTTARELGLALAAQAALLAALRPGPPGWAAGAVFAALAWSVLTAAFRHRRVLGPADHVTLVRVVLVGGVTALVAGHLATGGGPVAVLVATAAAALVLDGVDGRVARRTGTASEAGARFDMEVDAFLILVLSVQVAASAGPWVLAIGGMRYAFAAASWTAPWLRAPLPDSLARKTVAVVQGVVLAVAAAEVVPHAELAVAAALGLLAWSFGRDIVWLAALRRGNPQGRRADGARRPRVLDPVTR